MFDETFVLYDIPAGKETHRKFNYNPTLSTTTLCAIIDRRKNDTSEVRYL